MKYYLRKFIGFFITIGLVSLITFLVFQVLPGDSVQIILGIDADSRQVELLRESMGLNLPISVRYLNWIKGIFSLDLGISYRYKQPVFTLIQNGLGVTLSLALVSLLLTLVISFFLGILISRLNRRMAYLVSIISQIGMSTPSFCLAILLINIFVVKFSLFNNIFFVSIFDDFFKGISSVFLPALSIAIGASSTLIRYIQTSIDQEKKKDYVRVARSKGLSEAYIMYNHILKNSLIPVITVLGLLVSDILGGSIIIENIFNLPGIGKLILTAINTRDFPLIQGLVLYLSLIVVFCNFMVDILYSIIDPRIRLK